MLPINHAQRRIDEYLLELQSALGGLPNEQVNDTIQEIRTHLQDSASTDGELTDDSVAAALGRLGSPKQLAAMYVTENLIQRATATRSPWLVLRGTLHWATMSLVGVCALLGCVVGYALTAVFTYCALAKAFRPDRVGLWRYSDPDLTYSLHLGFVAPPMGTEVLGWYIVPVGLVLGIGLFLLTTQIALWTMRKFFRMRSSSALWAF